jgi:ArsR family transcriptional regulator
MKKKTALAALSALAQETRLDIFRLLVQAGGDGLPAGEIGERLGVPAPTLSFHLSQLKQARLVTCRRDSRSLIYAASYPAMNGLIAYLTEKCCRGAFDTAAEAAQAPVACAPGPAVCAPGSQAARGANVTAAAAVQP